MDIIAPAQRSALMSRIRGRDTKPELAVRRAAHALGYRFRLHRRDLPGSPDLVFPRLGKVIFVHGCFWHRHRGCRFANVPKSNFDFWATKFESNVRRDTLALQRLHELGWKTLVVWECEMSDASVLSSRLASFLGDQVQNNNQRGDQHGPRPRIS
jgi:DNA mismatch endonuclease (patch repair protein)